MLRKMNEETTETSLSYHEQVADGVYSLKRDLIFMKLGFIRSGCPQPLPCKGKIAYGISMQKDALPESL